MRQKKSAKDIAFDKERAKYLKKIRGLEHDISEFKVAIMRKDSELNILRNELEQKKDWIRRLLEYTELSQEYMKKIIEKEKITSEIMEHFQSMERIMSKFRF